MIVVEVSEDLIIESALALEEGLLLALDLTDAGFTFVHRVT